MANISTLQTQSNLHCIRRTKELEELNIDRSVSELYNGKWYNIKEWLFWTISRNDLDYLKSSIQLFPLKFYDSAWEEEFRIYLQPLFFFRCRFIGIVSLVLMITAFVIYLLIFILTGVIVSSLIAWVFSICNILSFLWCISLMLIPCLPKEKVNIEKISLIFVTLGSITNNFLNSWICYMMHNLSIVEGALMAKLWADICIGCTWLFGIIAMDAVLTARSHSTMYCHIIMVFSSTTPYLFQILWDYNELKAEAIPFFRPEFISAISAIEINTELAVICIGFIARMYKEFQERVQFLRLKKNINQINILLHKQVDRKKSAVTVAESLIEMIQKANYFIKCIAMETGNVMLQPCDHLLNECERTLSNTQDLFQVRLNLDNDNKNISAFNFFDYYGTNKQNTKKLVNKSGSDKVFSRKDTKYSHQRIPNIQSKLLSFDIPNEIESLRNKIGIDCSINLLQYHETFPHSFVFFGYILLEKYNKFLCVDPQTIQNFLYTVEEYYLPNPYHNSCHGLVVSNFMSCYINILGLFSADNIKGWEKPTLIVSALCHDVGHPGRNNNFYTHTNKQLAIIFNDEAVLENYHSFITFSILAKNIDDNELFSIRKRMIELILATDMSRHFELLSKFRLRKENTDCDFRDKEDDIWLLCRMCIKASDLSHSVVDWKQHLTWSWRITEEFYQQGNEEKNMKTDISPMCDRNTHIDFAKSQKGFLEFVVQPLLTELADIDYSDAIASDMIRSLVFNKFRWEEMIKKNLTSEIPESIQSIKLTSKDPVNILLQLYEYYHEQRLMNSN